jgi:hypothetical protein
VEEGEIEIRPVHEMQDFTAEVSEQEARQRAQSEANAKP